MLPEKPLISDKERARAQKVREVLSQGLSLYAHVSERVMVHTGIETTKKTKRAVTVKLPKHDWKSGDSTDLGKYHGGTVTKLGTRKVPVKDTDPDRTTLYCSFCEREIVDHSRATFGTKGAYRKYQGNPGRIVLLPKRYFKEKYFHRQERVVACPDCVLEIRPTLDDDEDSPFFGQVIRNNIIFPYDGG